MKSCEEYVVSRLQTLDEKCQHLESSNQVLTRALDRANARLASLKEMLLKHAQYETTSLNSPYIDFNAFYDRDWDADARADFNYMFDFLGVSRDQFKPYKAPEIVNTEEKENEDGNE